MNNERKPSKRTVPLRDGTTLELEYWEGRYEAVIVDFQSADEDAYDWDSIEIFEDSYFFRPPDPAWLCDWCGRGSLPHEKLVYGLNAPRLTVFKDTVCPLCQEIGIEAEYIALRKAGISREDALKKLGVEQHPA